MTGRFSLVEAGRDFVLVLVGEAVWGLIVGSALLWLRHFAREPRIEVMLSLLTPYFAFWPPHELGGSGVLATVVSGLYVGNAGVTLIRSNTRLQALFFWDFLNTTITGAIFLLTGLQARTIAFGLDAATLWRLMLDGVLVSVVVIVVRFLWVFPATYIPRWLFRSVRLHDPTPSWRFPFIIAFTGVRGVVSLAAALSVPVALAPGVAFPARDRLLVLVFVVIVVTLVAQGLTLPFVVRRLGLVQLGAAERRHRRRQEAAARLETARAALARLDDAAREHGLAPEALRSWRKKQQQRIDLLEHTRNPDGDGSVQATSMHRVELELLAAERARLNALLHEGRISDEIRRRIERDLDLAEERVRRNVRGIATDDDADADDPPRR
jgi:CPA1 family monovalent cation:H+ antiporter